MAYSIKVAKPKKRGKASLPSACSADHCSLAVDGCTNSHCLEDLKRQLDVAKNNNFAMSLTLDTQNDAAVELRHKILGNYVLTTDLLIQLENSDSSYNKAMSTKPESLECECIVCQFVEATSKGMILDYQKAATITRLGDLRDVEVKVEAAKTKKKDDEPSAYFGSGNYFARTGSYRGHGASALKPRLQMQSTYDVAALTTNSMMRKRLKTPSFAFERMPTRPAAPLAPLQEKRSEDHEPEPEPESYSASDWNKEVTAVLSEAQADSPGGLERLKAVFDKGTAEWQLQRFYDEMYSD